MVLVWIIIKKKLSFREKKNQVNCINKYNFYWSNKGFRSADQGGESGDKTERRKRSDEATLKDESSSGDVQGRSAGETDPRFLGAIGGLFGK